MTNPLDGPSLYEWAKERFELHDASSARSETVLRDLLKAESELRQMLDKSTMAKFADTEKLFNTIREMSDRNADKAESAQAAINIAQNEWRSTFQEYTKLTVLRPEYEKLSSSLDALRLEMATKFSAQSGEKSGAKESKDDSKSWMAIVISALAFLAAIAFGIMREIKL